MTDVLPRHRCADMLRDAATAKPAVEPAEPAVEPTPYRRQPRSAAPRWMRTYRIMLVLGDVVSIALAAVVGYLLRFGPRVHESSAAPYALVGALLCIGWLVAMQTSGAYELKHLTTGPEEAKRVLRASGLTAGVLATVCYASGTDVARGYVVAALPLGVLFLGTGRMIIRRLVQRRRRRGEWSHRILVVGTRDSVAHLLEAADADPCAGLGVVGACVEDARVGELLAPGVPVVGGVLSAAACADQVAADVVAVTGHGLGPVGVRQLGWQLEGTGRGLVMAPSLTEVAGTRVRITPVEGLPLVWLEQPQLGRIPRITKRVVDIAGALLLLVLAMPVMAVAAVAIKVSTRGPLFFRQLRLGTNGELFRIMKFRSMHVGAEERRAAMLELNEQDGAGVLFKVRDDPRVTPVGRVLRRFSIDELPQLFHVLSGRMSLVGPRPLAAADSIYTGTARRRLLVRPGLTGLWQVSGRSDTSWDDALRLDLYYVENWSLALDLGILCRTVAAVLGRHGAY